MAGKPLRLALAAALLAAPVALAADSAPSFKLEVDGDDGERVRIELSAGWLSTLVRHATFDCEGSDDRRTRQMAEALDRRGEGSVYEFEDRDGDEVVARRSRGQLILETRERDGDQSVVEMPWPLAECWMLGREPAGGFAGWMADEGFTLRVDARDGEGRVRIRFD
jgi:hypothetical protein